MRSDSPGFRCVRIAAVMTAMLLSAGNSAAHGLAPASAPAAESSILMTPPISSDGSRVKVTVGIYVINLIDIDEVEERFKFDAYLFARWSDPRLAFTPRDQHDRVHNYTADQIWRPKFEFTNGVQPHQRYDTEVRVAPDGAVDEVYRFDVTLSTTYRLRPFPFDKEMLEVYLQPFISDADHIEFAGDRVRSGISKESYAGMAQWNVNGLDFEGRQAQFDNTSRMLPELRFRIFVTRKFQFYIWKIFLPLLLMVVLSWTVFWVDPADLDNQIQISITTILTVIAFAFSISSTLPRVPYLTYIDAFFLTCYVFVFLSVIELMTVHVVARQRGEPAALRIRRNSRWVLPLAFLCTNLTLLARFFSP